MRGGFRFFFKGLGGVFWFNSTRGYKEVLFGGLLVI